MGLSLMLILTLQCASEPPTLYSFDSYILAFFSRRFDLGWDGHQLRTTFQNVRSPDVGK
ncbi:hypothetical protein HanIR_Chr05g0215171 [Helianthus annuus]|nr:hypothetical protein HanIR_Chr05g0215171 [Helianthus annuus]